MTARWLTKVERKVAADPFPVVVVFYILAFALLMWGPTVMFIAAYLLTMVAVGWLMFRSPKPKKKRK